MDVKELLESKKITLEEYEAYVLFVQSEVGSKWLNHMTYLTFMEEPGPHNCVGEAFAYTEGRRSIIRNVLIVKEKITNLLMEMNYDNGRTEPESAGRSRR